jgi:hypothetical protein
MPDLDKDITSKMSPLTKVNEKGEVVEDIRSVQLNEKISDEFYQILHPETDAYQVITDPERRFVSETEKAKWNEAYKLGASALHYRGEYVEGTLYKMYDVVYLNGDDYETFDQPYIDKGDGNGRRFFVYVNPEEAAQAENDGVAARAPEYDAFTSNYWVNINFESYLAEFSKNIQITRASDDTAYNIAVLNYSDGNYDVIKKVKNFIINPGRSLLVVGDGANAITIDGASGTITAKKFIGDLEGTADYAIVAEQYQKYLRDADHELVLDEDGNKQPDGTEYIDESLASIQRRLDDITNGEGGAVLSNKFYVQKNGENLNTGFDGSASQTVNITFNPSEITDLLDNRQKIKEKWLPETLLGAMTYIGTFDPSTGTLATDLREPAGRAFRKGDYAIAIKNGNQDPSGANHESDTAEQYYFLIGDWAVYNGDLDSDNTVDAEEWTKIDNTDAVRTVNSQIGDVKTYKGPWVSGTQYYQGDMVEAGDPAAVYVCINTNNDTVFSEDNFRICGRIYKADDGIELTNDDNTFRHYYKSSETITGTTTIKLKPKDTITVSNVEMYDKYGHVAKNNVNTYEMPDDTWRPVNVNGSQVQDNTPTSGPISIQHELANNDRRVNVNWDATNKNITILHNKNKNGAGSHTSAVLTSNITTGQIKIGLGSQFTAPNFGWGDTGHVDSYSTTTFELPTDLVQHKHFNVVLENGRSIIRSYTAAEYAALADKTRKFYDGEAVPSALDKISFNGVFAGTQLFQTSRSDGSKLYRTVDESAKIFGGKDYAHNNDILGSYDAITNRFELGNSGVHNQEGSVVYSAIAVNKKGIATAGGQILEFGTYSEATGSSDPSDSLVIGGLFFRNVGPKRDTNGVTE